MSVDDGGGHGLIKNSGPGNVLAYLRLNSNGTTILYLSIRREAYLIAFIDCKHQRRQSPISNQVTGRDSISSIILAEFSLTSTQQMTEVQETKYMASRNAKSETSQLLPLCNLIFSFKYQA